MFLHLRTKLTVLYASLFGVSLLLGAAAVYTAIASNAERAVRRELESSGTVFDRIWTLRSRQLQDGAALLSRDFGFREAVATKDAATIQSALNNLRARFGADMAFIVGLNGTVTSADGRALKAATPELLRSLNADAYASGVFTIEEAPYQAISAPIMSPTLMGWVVFANRLDDKEMASLERLSSIPLTAAIVHRDASGQWVEPQASGLKVDRAELSRFIDGQLRRRSAAAELLATPSGRDVALVKPLQSMSSGAPAALILRYPLARALASYRLLLESMTAAAILGFVMLVLGSWALARGVTRPISALDEAARRLQHGENVSVEVGTQDEIGRLAISFNTMAAEIRAREQRITHLAMHDPETDLPNRLALESLIAPAGKAGGQLVVAALGVDRFTHVRGAIGYALANALIGEIGAKLQRLRPDHHLARLSTDVIGVAFRAADPDSANRIVAETLAALEAPLRLGDNTIDVSLKAGIAIDSQHGDRVASLVERANIALDQARTARQKIAFFDPAAYGDPSSNLSLMSEMLRSIERGEMVLHHQPKLDLRKGAVTGVEALVRWRHPTRGLLGPDVFITMAEETGHIGALTEWVLARAIEEQALMRREGHDMTMSVNLSGRLLGDADFAATALDMVRGSASGVCFEITETAVIENPAVALQVIDEFAASGIAMSIDDYGSGLSSLAYLKQIRADELKIDKAFIFKIDESQKDALLVRSTIDLAHSLGLKVTAEGVETPVALSLVAGMGADMAQGFLIARPIPLKELLTFLAQEKRHQRLYG